MNKVYHNINADIRSAFARKCEAAFAGGGHWRSTIDTITVSCEEEEQFLKEAIMDYHDPVEEDLSSIDEDDQHYNPCDDPDYEISLPSLPPPGSC